MLRFGDPEQDARYIYKKKLKCSKTSSAVDLPTLFATFVISLIYFFFIGRHAFSFRRSFAKANKKTKF